MSYSFTLADLRRAVEALPAGSSITLTRDSLLQALSGNGHVGAPMVQQPDRLLKVREAATRLGVSARYLYGHADELPFTKRLSPKALRFSEQGLERWLARTQR